jgi:hypothetical protein
LINTINVVGRGDMNHPFPGMFPLYSKAFVVTPPSFCGEGDLDRDPPVPGGRSGYSYHLACQLKEGKNIWDGCLGPKGGGAFADLGVDAHKAAVLDSTTVIFTGPGNPGIPATDPKVRTIEKSFAQEVLIRTKF